MSPLVRKMEIEDVPAAHEIDKSSFTLPWPERSLRFEVSDNPVARCWVAELEGRVVGMLVLWMIIDEAHIATLAIHPDFRRQGIAEQLLITALRKAHAEGAQTALLEVRAENQAAQALYAKYGFDVVGRREHYYKDNNEDAVLMTLSRLPVIL
ncbi:MAG: ribosomal protein S18-alanine N-acetyltransferase [Anaerolineales bacterium]